MTLRCYQFCNVGNVTIYISGLPHKDFRQQIQCSQELSVHHWSLVREKPD